MRFAHAVHCVVKAGTGEQLLGRAPKLDRLLGLGSVGHVGHHGVAGGAHVGHGMGHGVHGGQASVARSGRWSMASSGRQRTRERGRGRGGHGGGGGGPGGDHWHRPEHGHLENWNIHLSRVIIISEM